MFSSRIEVFLSFSVPLSVMLSFQRGPQGKKEIRCLIEYNRLNYDRASSYDYRSPWNSQKEQGLILDVHMKALIEASTPK